MLLSLWILLILFSIKFIRDSDGKWDRNEFKIRISNIILFISLKLFSNEDLIFSIISDLLLLRDLLYKLVSPLSDLDIDSFI